MQREAREGEERGLVLPQKSEMGLISLKCGCPRHHW